MESLEKAANPKAVGNAHDPRWNLVGFAGAIVGISFVSQIVYCLVGGWPVVPQDIIVSSLEWPAIVLFVLLVRKLPADLRPGARKRAAEKLEASAPGGHEIPFSTRLILGALILWFPIGVLAATLTHLRTNASLLAGDLLAQGAQLGLAILVPAVIAAAVFAIRWLRKPAAPSDEYPIRRLLP